MVLRASRVYLACVGDLGGFRGCLVVMLDCKVYLASVSQHYKSSLKYLMSFPSIIPLYKYFFCT